MNILSFFKTGKPKYLACANCGKPKLTWASQSVPLCHPCAQGKRWGSLVAGSKKLCRKCGEWKDKSEFHFKKGCVGGIRPECKACGNIWKRAHPLTISVSVKNRRARIRGSVGKITAAEIRELRAKQDYTCLCCLRREPEIELTHDHVKPIAMNGDNTIENSQMLCRSCNSRKGARWIDYRST